MSILIRGMEMPSCCDECRFLDEYGDYPFCIITDEQRGYNFKTREKHMDNCPLVPVPPHGRLIDADKEMARVQKLYDNAIEKDPDMGCVNVYEGEIAVLQLAPTVIEAEEGE